MGGFKAEGRHKPVKQEVKNRSFKGIGKRSSLKGGAQELG